MEYDDYQDWTAEGKYTRITPIVKKIALQAGHIQYAQPYAGLPRHFINELEIASNICQYIERFLIRPEQSRPSIGKKIISYFSKDKPNLEKESDIPIELYQPRPLEKILYEGMYNTCQDKATVLRGFLIANNIPASYILAFDMKKIYDKKHIGHIFVRIFNENGSIFIDPYIPCFEYYRSQKKMWPYVIYSQGRDSADFGIGDISEIRHIKEGFASRLRKDKQRKSLYHILTDSRRGANADNFNHP